jgi:hypothetical protein
MCMCGYSLRRCTAITKRPGILKGWVRYRANYALRLVQIGGTQTSTHPQWRGAAITYWGTADLMDGSGPQRGTFSTCMPVAIKTVAAARG